MACNVTQNSIDFLKTKGFLSSTMKIENPMFYAENIRLTQIAKDKYGLVAPEGEYLFKTDSKVVRDGVNNPEGVFAIVNEPLFEQLQGLHDNYKNDYFQQDSESTEEVSEGLNKKIQMFLEKIGVELRAVNNITDSLGNPLSAIAKADMLNKVIEIVEGREKLDTLPEEAAHFFVEMLGPTHPLYKEMYDKVTGYQEYRKTLEQYGNNPDYRLPNKAINFDKIKKEAIGKIIAKHILQQDPGTENETKLAALVKWWSKLWKLITNIFTRADNPFEQAATQITEGDITGLDSNNLDGSVYYQLDDTIAKIEEDQKRLTLDNSIDTQTGQKRHIYYYDGKKVKGSVTTTKVDAYLKSIFPNDRRSDRQKELDLLKAEYGDAIHQSIEHIIDSYVDPQTHLVRETPAVSLSPYVSEPFYTILDAYVKELIGTYEQGTKFLREIKVYDSVENIAGSIDFVAITPDGTANIYDWKSQEIGYYQTELKPYKEKAYRIQLQAYKQILQTFYGVEKFGKIRAIPIKTVYDASGIGDARNINGLKTIEIGTVESAYTEKDYLLPITLREEKQDDEGIAQLTKKLTDVMEVMELKKFKPAEKLRREEELKKYKSAIRDLNLRNDIRKFIELGNYEVNKYSALINSNTLTEKDAIESLDTLKVFSGTTYNFEHYLRELRNLQKNSTVDAEKEIIQNIINSYNSLNSSVDIILKKMEIAIQNLGTRIAEQETGIKNLLNPEKELGAFSGMFTSLSTIPLRAFRVFSKVLGRAQNKRDYLHQEYSTRLYELQKNLKDWATKKGLSGTDMFNGILEVNSKGEWNGEFLRRYNKEFYTDRNKALTKGDGEWFKNNTTFDEERYEKDAIKRWEYIQSIEYSSDPDQNASRQMNAMNNWVMDNNVNAMPGGNPTAYQNKRNPYLKPISKWETDKWKSLNEKGNEPLKAVYDEFQKLLRHSEQLGILDEYSPGFIPNMNKSKLEQLVFGGEIFNNKGFFEDLEVANGGLSSPQIDPITGKVVSKIPIHFLRDLGVEREDGTYDYTNKSKDLFKVFSVWTAQMSSYEAMSEIEDVSNLLVHVERNKDHLVTNAFGSTVTEGGDIKIAKGNESNAQKLQEFVNFYMYNELSGKLSDTKFKVAGKEYSLSKSVSWFMNFFSLKTLALNPISGVSQLVGGTGNAFFQASKKNLFNTKDWTSSMYDISRRDPKTFALLHESMVLMEDRKHAISNELSVSKIMNFNTMDKMYFIQRGSDKAVQYPVAIALMKNHMIDENGNIVDITKYVKQKHGYFTKFYSLPTSEREAMKALIEKEVTELKETKSIFNIAKVENDRLEVPGVKFNSPQWADFRSKIKQTNKFILGNSTRDDVNRVRTTQIGMAFMQFRSWIPQMVQERAGALKYNQDLDTYTIGKARLFFSEVFSKRGVALAKSIINSTGSDIIAAAKERYLIEKSDAIQQGQEFTITEAEFVDLYIGNVRSELRELATIVGFGMLLLWAKPGADDDDEYKGLRKYTARALNRFYNEFSFYYLPTSATDLIKAPIPVVGLAEDFIRFTEGTGKQFFGFVSSDEELQKDAKPLKYVFRMMPILKEGMVMRSVFDDDFRKEWGINIR